MLKSNVGILGFGVVGKSVLQFLRSVNSQVEIGVWDQRNLDEAEVVFLNSCKALNYDSSKIKIQQFFSLHDQIIISPGISLNRIFPELTEQDIQKRCFCELDFFAQYFNKKSVAITGTLGKTTVTNLIGFLSSKLSLKNENKFLNVEVGGNIGNGMLELAQKQQNFDLAVLELSSFQLMLNKNFGPDVAVWTNFYANHLDWHTSIDEYFDAKFKIFESQKKDDFAVIPAFFLKNSRFLEKAKNLKSRICFVCDLEFSKDLAIGILKKNNFSDYSIFYIEDKNCYIDGVKLCSLEILPDVTFIQNWFLVLSTLYFLNLDLSYLEKYLSLDEAQVFSDQGKNLQKHRLEKIATIEGVDFYDDSKATVIQATLAAVKKLDQNNRPIILLLGGLSKGVDRAPLLEELKNISNLKKIICFGLKCDDFKSVDSYSSLEDAFTVILQIMQKGDQILFSPSGASFDLFKDYKHRGDVFKNLVFRVTDGSFRK